MGVALAAATVASGGAVAVALATIFSSALIGGGVSSLLGGWFNKAQGKNFSTGWLGGEISGAITGAGIGAGGFAFTKIALSVGASAAQFVGGLSSLIGLSGIGGGFGGAASSAYTQNKETGIVNTETVLKQGLISAGIAMASWPFTAVGSALGSAGEKVAAIVSLLVEEGTFDMSSSIASASVSG